jgi:hypothetical protein
MSLPVFLALMTLIVSADEAVKPPVAKIVPAPSTTLGEKRVDNYSWLRDRANPDTIQYLEAENEYTKAAMKGRLFLLHADRGRKAVRDLLPQARRRWKRRSAAGRQQDGGREEIFPRRKLCGEP